LDINSPEHRYDRLRIPVAVLLHPLEHIYGGGHSIYGGGHSIYH
jgi:hypothetical protein